MEGLYRCVVSLPPVTGLPEDVRQNTLYFFSASDDSHDDNVDLLHARVVDFYNTVHTGATESLSDFIGEQISRTSNAASTTWYFIASTVPNPDWGSPVAMRSWTVGPADSGTPMPAEVAVCISYHADLTDIPEVSGSTRPASRLRGRIFLGPLQHEAGAQQGASGDWVPSSDLKNACDAAAQELHGDNDVNGLWTQWSPTSGIPSVVTGGYVDDAFDTQRRRGTAPTSRLSWGT